MKAVYKLIRAVELLQEAQSNLNEFANKTGFRVELNIDEIKLKNVGYLNLDELSEFAKIHEKEREYTSEFIADFGETIVHGITGWEREN